MLVVEIRFERLQEWLAARFLDPKCSRNRRTGKVGIANGRQLDESDAIAVFVEHLPATSIARRVLPVPPGPLRVTRRTAGSSSRCRTSCTSRSRPMNDVGCEGRFAGYLLGVAPDRLSPVRSGGKSAGKSGTTS